jgi:uncharacterized YccA/Bax inhibitor family protein
MGQNNNERKFFRSSNPVMSDSAFDRIESGELVHGATMTLNGTVAKLGIMFAVLLPSAVIGWMNYSPTLFMGSLILGLIIGVATGFVPKISPYTAIPYSLLQGLFLGAFSLYATEYIKAQPNAAQYANVVPIAAFATIITLGVTLVLYATRIVRVGDTMRAVIFGLTGAVGIFYLFSFALSFFAPAMVGSFAVFGSGPIGIGFSLFVIGLAAFNFFTDYDMIERAIQRRSPKYMEWYGAFGVMVTLIWLYLEIVRLMMKLARR